MTPSNNNTTKLPLTSHRSITNFVASNSTTKSIVTNSNVSPAKRFLLATTEDKENNSTTTRRRTSLEGFPSGSPMATPPKRRLNALTTENASNRLNAYGVPIVADQFSVTLRTPSLVNNNLIVCVRKKPISSNDHDVTSFSSASSITVAEKKRALDGFSVLTDMHTFHFDHVFDTNVSNEQVFETLLGRIICDDALRTVICFAYGQTGSGKTHSMFDPQTGNRKGRFHHII